jgi:hypothetical protein
MVFKKLSTLKEAQKFSANNIQNITCPRCQTGEDETYEHLWECPDTKARKEKLLEGTSQYMNERVKTYIQETLLKEQNIESIIDYAEGNYNEFIATETAKGIITHKFRNKFQQTTHIQNDINNWIFLFIDSWLSAFYRVVWQRRNELIARRIESQIAIVPDQPDIAENSETDSSVS